MAGNSILRKTYVNIREQMTATAVAITPGFLLERTTTANECQAHSTAGGTVAPLFAVEDAYQGVLFSTAYAVSAQIHTIRPVPGEIVQGVANSAITIGDFIESAGNGKLRKTLEASSAGFNEFPHSIVGQALEAAAADGDLFDIEIM